MLPGVFEFRWDVGHVVFVGAFFMVLGCVGITLLVAGWRARRDRALERSEAIRWHEEFEALPEASRPCRHQLDGLFRARTCDNAFECAHCAMHAKIAASGLRAPAPVSDAAGIEVPEDRMYDRGHTWVQEMPDGAVRIGLDPLALRLVGAPDAVELPAKGTRLRRHGTAWRLSRRGVDLRILAPVDGVVRDTAGAEREWTLELEPAGGAARFAHLLRGAEARVWMVREIERLQQLASSDGLGATLADGGALAPDLGAHAGAVQWERLCDEILLQG
jgi:glycine cleavage system H lipoate-binding protein